MNNRAPWFAAVAAATFAALCPAQQVRITNMADLPRAQWVDIAVPLSDAAALPELCQLSPQGFTVWKGATIGQHSQLFHAFVELLGNESIQGRIVPVSANPADMREFEYSDWFADDTFMALPRLRVMAGGVEHRITQIEVGQIEDNRARRVFHLRARIGTTPLVLDQWIYAWSMQDMVRFEMTITNSDPRTTDWSFGFDYLWVEAGEYLHFDYRIAEGMDPPALQNFAPGLNSYGNWFQFLSTRRTMGRGEQLFYSGSVFTLATLGTPVGSLSYEFGQRPIRMTAQQRMENFFAQGRGPLVGVCLDWDGKWLANGVVPEILPSASNGGWTAANASAAAFQQVLRTPRDIYSARPRGLSRYAGTTGAQEDFGASKGTFAVSVGDPRYLHEAGYSMYEMFARPFHYREVDNSPLLAANHPGLRTWGQLINCRTTRDFLGYQCPFPYSWPSNGWSSIDDQHRSQNNFNAQLALTGSYALRQSLKDLLEVDRTQQPGFSDSPRGEGRLMLAWANMLLLLDSPADRALLQAHMLQRVQNLRSHWPGGRFVGDPAHPIRVMEVGSSPTFFEPNGDRVPSIVVWEHSIAAMGYFAAWRVTGDPQFRDMAAEVSRLVVNHCIYQQNGTWIACTVVRYLQGAHEGEALPASSYYSGSPDIQVGVNFWEWIFPSVLVCRELYRNVDPALVQRCDQIVAAMGPPVNWSQAEWWAVLPR